MRSVIVNSARERIAQRRGGDLRPLTLSSQLPGKVAENEETILSVHQALEALEQADPRLLPVALHRALGDAQRFSYFLLAVTTKVAHLPHLGQARVRLLHSLQRLVNTQDRFLVFGDLARQLAR